jgi:hypothetical protein
MTPDVDIVPLWGTAMRVSVCCDAVSAKAWPRKAIQKNPANPMRYR